jgi:hypothetical protein
VKRLKLPALVLIALAVSLLMAVGVAIAALPPTGTPIGATPGGTFTDDNGNVHEGNIEAIAADGITRGCNPPVNTSYCPPVQ